MGAQKNRIHVGDIRRFLEEKQWSPEAFAREVGLSHMTIRRWLEKSDRTPLPAKYNATLGPRLTVSGTAPRLGDIFPQARPEGFSCTNVSEMVGDLEKNGRDYPDVKSLGGDVSRKLKSERFDTVFVRHCRQLLKAIFSRKVSKRKKAVAVGALLYFLNPIDLIPDNIPVIGYLDDLAVLTLAVNVLAENDKNLPELVEAD
jgi:uncharacterized membrane protein YkvA (DUF1232 family)